MRPKRQIVIDSFGPKKRFALLVKEKQLYCLIKSKKLGHNCANAKGHVRCVNPVKLWALGNKVLFCLLDHKTFCHGFCWVIAYVGQRAPSHVWLWGLCTLWSKELPRGWLGLNLHKSWAPAYINLVFCLVRVTACTDPLSIVGRVTCYIWHQHLWFNLFLFLCLF